MARTVAEINSYIVDRLVSQMLGVGIVIDPTLWSKRSLLRAICYTVAIAQALLEQLNDAFMEDVEAVVSTAAAASAKWVQAKMFEFQYSATNPQVIALINTVPVYPIVDPTLRIITACSVTSDLSNAVIIKIAKGNPFQALAGLEKSAAQGYINTIGIAGIRYFVQSLDPDNLFIEADIYFQGQFAPTISDQTIATIQNFLQQQAVINFDGEIQMSDLEQAIRNSPGVTDVVLKNVRGRSDADLFAAGIDLILGTEVLQRQWSTVSGYAISETDSGHTLADSLNFIAE